MSVRITGVDSGGNKIFRMFPACSPCIINCENEGKVTVRVKQRPETMRCSEIIIYIYGSSDPCAYWPINHSAVDTDPNTREIASKFMNVLTESEVEFICDDDSRNKYVIIDMAFTDGENVTYELAMEVEIG